MAYSHSVVLTLLLGVLLCAAIHADDTPKQAADPIVLAYGIVGLDDTMAARLADGGWNLVLCQEKHLDILQPHGLKAVMSGEFLNPAALDDPVKREKLDAMIERVKNHPALGMYWIVDEPNASRFAELGRLLAYVRERDPDHPGYINLYPTYAKNEQLGNEGDTVTAYQAHVNQFLEQARPDYLSYDHYHFRAGGKDTDQYFLNLALMRQAALGANLPFMDFLQSCTWDVAWRAPDISEMRFLTYSSLAYGSNGVGHYTYMDRTVHTHCPADADGEPRALWHGLKRINHEFVAIREQLARLRSLGAYHIGMIPPGGMELPLKSPFTLEPPIARMDYTPPEPIKGMLIGAFGADGKPTHAVVVNLDYSEAATTTVLGPGPLEVFNASTGQWRLATGGNRARLHLLPGGGELVRVRW